MTFDEQMAFIHNATKPDDVKLLVSSMRYLENPHFYQEKFRQQLNLMQKNGESLTCNDVVNHETRFDLSRALASALYCNWIEIRNISQKNSACNSLTNTPVATPSRITKKEQPPVSNRISGSADQSFPSSFPVTAADVSSLDLLNASQQQDISGSSDPDYADAIDWKGMDPADVSASRLQDTSGVEKCRKSSKVSTAINGLIVPSPLSLPAKHFAVHALSGNPMKLKSIYRLVPSGYSIAYDRKQFMYYLCMSAVLQQLWPLPSTIPMKHN
jgi:hypothetical protein